MRPLMRPVAAAALIAAGLLYVSATNVQAQSPTTGLSDRSKNIPDQKLDAAAAALQQLAILLPDYQQKLAAAPPSDKQRVADEANNALSKAVTDQGLSVEEYNTIMAEAQNDPDVREKIRQRLPPTAK
jgi:F0F1-type ATP synthase membrane subunit b/b'